MILSGRQRIVAATAATLEWQPVDQHGEPSDPGTVTVTVVRADGSTVKAAGTATSGTGAAVRTVALTPAETADLDTLTATWEVDDVVRGVTYHDIVGGVYCTLARLRASAPTLDKTDAELRVARAVVEATFERSCRRAFVPRFSVVRAINGFASVRDVRLARWARTVADEPTTVTPQWAYDARGVHALSGFSTVDSSLGLDIGVEHGMDAPPADVVEAAIIAIQDVALRPNSGIDSRAMSYTTPEGMNMSLATPALGPWVTGIPRVDEVLKAYRAESLPRSVTLGGRGFHYPILRVN